MRRSALTVTAALLVWSPAFSAVRAAPDYGPPPGVLPSGFYSASPLARLAGGSILYSSGERASGTGVFQREAANAQYTTVARWRDSLLACGIKRTRTGYFSGTTGQQSCVVHGPASSRDVHVGPRRGQRPFDDIAVEGDTLIALDGTEVLAIDLGTGQRLASANRPRRWPRLTLPARPRPKTPQVNRGAEALLRTPGGLVHARLVDRGAGWEVLSRRVTWTDRSIVLGPISAAWVAPELQPIGHGLKLVSGGLDGRRFLASYNLSNTVAGAAGRLTLVELAGNPTLAEVRWSGEGAARPTTDVAAAAENGLVGFGGSGVSGVVVVDLRQPGARRRVHRLSPPVCAVSRRPGQLLTARADVITGARGPEVVAQWPAGDLPRCWSTERIGSG